MISKRIVAIATLLSLSWLTPAWATEDRQDYVEISPTEFEERFTVDDFTPRNLGLQLFQELGPREEGRQAEKLSVDYYWQEEDAQFGATVMLAIIGSADDSVGGWRLRLDLISDSELGWQLVWVGQQVRCRRGRGPQDWTKEHCS